MAPLILPALSYGLATLMFFSILGSLIAFTLPLAMVGKFTRANAPRIILMGLTFGLVSAAGMLITFSGIFISQINDYRRALNRSRLKTK